MLLPAMADWNEPALRIDVKWADKDAEYDDIVEIDVSGGDTKTIEITSPIIPSKCPSSIDHSSGVSSGNVKNVSC